MKYLILALLCCNAIFAQNLDKHLWQSRVIIISANKANTEQANLQYAILNAEQQALTERKLVIYKCIDKVCTIGQGKIMDSSRETSKAVEAFSVILIGLDGKEKYKTLSVQKANVFFERIDKMPMRRRELQQKQ